MLLPTPQIVEESFFPLAVPPAGAMAADAGHDSALLLWAIFWVLAGAVAVAFTITVAPPLQRRLAQAAARHPVLPAIAVLAGSSVFMGYFLLILTLDLSNARLSMLVSGRIGQFFHAIFFPYGRLSVIAVACGLLWVGMQGRILWMIWALLSRNPRPRGSSLIQSSGEHPVGRPRRWLLWFIVFTVAALVLVVFLAMRLYTAQLAVERDMAANQASTQRLSESQADVAKLQLRHGDASALVAASTRAAELAEASALVGNRLDAAVQERNRRRSVLEIAAAGVVLIGLLAVVRRFELLIRRGRNG